MRREGFTRPSRAKDHSAIIVNFVFMKSMIPLIVRRIVGFSKLALIGPRANNREGFPYPRVRKIVLQALNFALHEKHDTIDSAEDRWIFKTRSDWSIR
jgi:hypothetical protein